MVCCFPDLAPVVVNSRIGNPCAWPPTLPPVKRYQNTWSATNNRNNDLPIEACPKDEFCLANVPPARQPTAPLINPPIDHLTQLPITNYQLLFSLSFIVPAGFGAVAAVLHITPAPA